jgi:anti-sigma factor RsiW
MTIHPDSATLQRHLDGELALGDSRATEAHLRGCTECRSRLTTLRQLVSSVESLPSEIEPPHDLWEAIAGRIALESPSDAKGEVPLTSEADSLARLRSRRRITVRLGWLTAIAASLFIGVAIGSLLPRPAEEALQTADMAAPPPAVLASFETPEYDAAIADLEAILAGMRDELRPETVAALEENLAIIDAAIAEARAALLADPANEHLQRHVTASMQTKLRLLRTVTSVVTAEI